MGEKTPEKRVGEMPLVEHLSELRRVLIISITATLAMAVVAYYFSDLLLTVLLDPVTSMGYKVIFTGVPEALLTKIKLSLMAGFLMSLPIVLWQVWVFVSPALYKNERIYFSVFLFLSLFSFAGGIIFAFFYVYRFAVMFLLRFAGPQLLPMLTIDKYVSFTITFTVPFGLVFELPIASFMLANLGLINYRFLSSNRKYAVMVCLVLAALLTPTPDLLTCLIMAGPMYTLYEMSVWIVLLVEKRKKRKAERAELEEVLSH